MSRESFKVIICKGWQATKLVGHFSRKGSDLSKNNELINQNYHDIVYVKPEVNKMIEQQL